ACPLAALGRRKAFEPDLSSFIQVFGGQVFVPGSLVASLDRSDHQEQCDDAEKDSSKIRRTHGGLSPTNKQSLDSQANGDGTSLLSQTSQFWPSSARKRTLSSRESTGVSFVVVHHLHSSSPAQHAGQGTAGKLHAYLQGTNRLRRWHSDRRHAKRPSGKTTVM